MRVREAAAGALPVFRELAPHPAHSAAQPKEEATPDAPPSVSTHCCSGPAQNEKWCVPGHRSCKSDVPASEPQQPQQPTGRSGSEALDWDLPYAVGSWLPPVPPRLAPHMNGTAASPQFYPTVQQQSAAIPRVSTTPKRPSDLGGNHNLRAAAARHAARGTSTRLKPNPSFFMVH